MIHINKSYKIHFGYTFGILNGCHPKCRHAALVKNLVICKKIQFADKNVQHIEIPSKFQVLKYDK